MARLLLADDEPGMLFALKELVESRGHEAVLARNGREALERLEGVDAVVTDHAMPELDGSALLRAIRERDPTLPVILLTAHGSEKLAVQAMKAGAYDYVAKPFDIEEMGVVLERALEARALRVQNRRLTAEKALGKVVVAESAAMRRLLEAAGRVAPRDITVLVRGPTGTGKELVAALLHAESRRATGPLVRFNCAAIPGELAEAELFGHARGAFTGATQARRGFFAEAHLGTLVLDEVGELPAPVQAKLLRALQEGEIQPVGAGRVEKVDVRVIACTNRDLLAEARAGRFREDLYYRLAVVLVATPPLRERREDIPELAARFLAEACERNGRRPMSLSREAVVALQAHQWPGNVRELKNVVERLAILSDGPALGPEEVAVALPGVRRPRTDRGRAGAGFHELVEEAEREIILAALQRQQDNVTEAARALGLERSHLYKKMRALGIKREE